MRSYGFAADVPGASSAWELLWVLFVLGVIIVSIVLLLRFIGKRNRSLGMNRSLRSLGGITLGTNKSMQIVAWNDRIYVLGVGENVSVVEAITDPEAVAILLTESEAQFANSSANGTLMDYVRKWNARFRSQSNRDPEDRQLSQPESFEQTLEARLREMSERRQRMEQLLDKSSSEDRKERT